MTWTLVFTVCSPFIIGHCPTIRIAGFETQRACWQQLTEEYAGWDLAGVGEIQGGYRCVPRPARPKDGPEV